MSKNKKETATPAATVTEEIEQSFEIEAEVEIEKKFSIEDQLAEIDGKFPVEWAGREIVRGDGGFLKAANLKLNHTVFRVVNTPAPMFGQNIGAFGFESAAKLAEESKHPQHDFGACYVKKGSLRKEANGKWYVDLTVDTAKVRFCPVTTVLVDAETGEPLLDSEGNEQHRTAPRKESWITCELSMLEPIASHPFDAEYRQSDRRTTAQLRMVKDSKEATQAKEQSGVKKTRQRVLSKKERAALALAGLDL